MSKSQNLTNALPCKGFVRKSRPHGIPWQLDRLHYSTESQFALYACCSKLVHSSPVALHFCGVPMSYKYTEPDNIQYILAHIFNQCHTT